MASTQSNSRLGSDAAKLVRQLTRCGPRNARDDERYYNLCRARDLILEHVASLGHSARCLTYYANRRQFDNIEVELRGSDASLSPLIVGAHYDTARRSPGANDNASGVACLLAALPLLRTPLARTIRLVAFTNEEPPFTRRTGMGSLQYARACADRGEKLWGMISLEMLARERAPQPQPLLLVSNLPSRSLLKEVHEPLRKSLATEHVVRRLLAPGVLPGVRSSDHWSFWQTGYRALMLTAGGPLAFAHYHRRSDDLAHVDLSNLQSLAIGLARTLQSPAIQGR